MPLLPKGAKFTIRELDKEKATQIDEVGLKKVFNMKGGDEFIENQIGTLEPGGELTSGKYHVVRLEEPKAVAKAKAVPAPSAKAKIT